MRAGVGGWRVAGGQRRRRRFEGAAGTHPPRAGKTHEFAFDFSYNSFDPPDTPGYASQAVVWNDIGDGVLANAYEGAYVRHSGAARANAGTRGARGARVRRRRGARG